MNWLKKFIIILSTFLIVVFLILFALTKAIKPAIIKEFVNAQLSAATHQPTLVEGDISWQIFPRPSIKMMGIQIGDKEKNSPYLVKLNSLTFNLQLTPLLRGQLIFSEINVDNFQITINTRSQPEKLNQVKETRTSKKNSLAQRFAIKSILLSKGKLILKYNQKIIVLSNLQLGAEQVNLKDNAFPFQLKSLLQINETADTSLIKARINFTGNTTLSTDLFSNPLAAVKNILFNGQLLISDFKIKEVNFNKITAHLKMQSGILTLNPLTIDLYDGISVGQLMYDWTTNKLAIDQTATNINSNKFTYSLLGKHYFKGDIDFSIHSQTNLQRSPWKENTIGNGSLTIKEGAFETFDIDKVVSEINNTVNMLLGNKGKNLQQLTELSKLKINPFLVGGSNFNLLTLQYVLQNNTLHLNSIVFQTNKLQLKGNGELNLNNNYLDSHFLIQVDTTKNSDIKQVQELLGGGFPITITGNIAMPLVLPDLKIIYPIITKFWMRETVTQSMEQIQKQIKKLIPKQKTS